MTPQRDPSLPKGLSFAPRSERETIVADARHVLDLEPASRAEAFIGLGKTLEAVLAHLAPSERRRRRFAAKMLDPLPDPWWKRLRRTEWPVADVVR